MPSQALEEWRLVVHGTGKRRTSSDGWVDSSEFKHVSVYCLNKASIKTSIPKLWCSSTALADPSNVHPPRRPESTNPKKMRCVLSSNFKKEVMYGDVLLLPFIVRTISFYWQIIDSYWHFSDLKIDRRRKHHWQQKCSNKKNSLLVIYVVMRLVTIWNLLRPSKWAVFKPPEGQHLFCSNRWVLSAAWRPAPVYQLIV